MRATVTALALVAAFLGGCYTVDNPNFCCLSRETCNGHGTTEPIPCKGGRICDEARYTCVDPHNGGSCSSPDQCSTITPFCVMGSCVQCQGASEGCSSALPACEADNVCGACMTEQACSSYTTMPHCETSGTAAGSCVQCRTGKSDDCTATGKPICDQSQCRACREGECPSGVCDVETGACIAETGVVYVATTGQPGGCSKAAPCATFAQGLAAISVGRDHMLVAAGGYREAVVAPPKTVAIYAAGADLQPVAIGDVAFDVEGAANVTVHGLRIHGAGGATGDGVLCRNQAASSPTLNLHGMKIDGNAGKGINATSCAVTVDRSTISTNAGGGIALSGSTFTLTNNFIVGNGSSSSTAGGVSVQSVTSLGTHTLSFNTISRNNATDGVNSGVDCVLVGTPLSFDNSIVYANQTLGSGKQVGGNMCSWSYSNIGDSVSGAGNISLDPKFVSASMGDFHLLAGSPSIDAADPAATTPIDFDGDARPHGARDDQGADEVTQP